MNRLTSKVTDHLLSCKCTKLDKTEFDGGLWCKALNLNLTEVELKDMDCFVCCSFIHQVRVSTFMNEDRVYTSSEVVHRGQGCERETV